MRWEDRWWPQPWCREGGAPDPHWSGRPRQIHQDSQHDHSWPACCQYTTHHHISSVQAGQDRFYTSHQFSNLQACSPEHKHLDLEHDTVCDTFRTMRNSFLLSQGTCYSQRMDSCLHHFHQHSHCGDYKPITWHMTYGSHDDTYNNLLTINNYLFLLDTQPIPTSPSLFQVPQRAASARRIGGGRLSFVTRSGLGFFSETVSGSLAFVMSSSVETCAVGFRIQITSLTWSSAFIRVIITLFPPVANPFWRITFISTFPTSTTW